MLDKIKWFWRYYKNYKYVLAVLLLLTPIQVVFQVSIPRLIEFTVDYVKNLEISTRVGSSPIAIRLNETGQNLGLSTALTLTLALVFIGLTASVLYTFVQSHRAWMNMRLEWLFRQDAFNKITVKGPDFFNHFRTGDIITRLTDDVAEKLSWFACSGIFRLYEALLMVAFSIAMMISINPVLTLWSAGPLPILIVIFFFSSSLLDKRYEFLQKRISDFNDVMEACFSGIRVVKAYVREKAQKKKFSEVIQRRREAEISTIKAMTLVESCYFYIWQFGILIVLTTGGYMVIHAGLTEGQLVAFIYYIIYMVFPMFDIGQFLVKSRQSAVSINRLQELEKFPALVEDNGTFKTDSDIKGAVSFEDVSFAFPDSKTKILDRVNFEIKPGQTIALVGKVGSGKSWLSNLIPRLVDPSGGQVKLDGHDLRKFRLEDLRRQVGYVPQEPVLFSDTIRRNILFGREDISEEVLNWAVEVSQLRDEIATFPKGLDTEIGTRGMSISGGQKQRLALARALVGKPKILILDDCTSALDSRTETALWEQLHKVMPEMTAILVTHRPDTLEQADMIYVMEDGHIVESGTHHELMSRESHYARIYKRYQLAEQVSG
ncbi:MAG: ABC transporter ATP-binding protein [candidate division Zixibacteria bacterium]|nr:ABC transporter ATP-binding protein [candidate division Zixibacteria bacterium]